MKKEDFLNKLRQNTHFQYDMPKEEIKGIEYEDTLKQFIEMTESVGGHVINDASAGSDLNALVCRAYPDARVFASNLEEITVDGLKANAGDGAAAVELRNPDTAHNSKQASRTKRFLPTPPFVAPVIPPRMQIRPICIR